MRLRTNRARIDWLDVTAAYGMGIVAAYWPIERTTAFF